MTNTVEDDNCALCISKSTIHLFFFFSSLVVKFSFCSFSKMAVALLLMVAVGTVVRSSLVLDAVDVLASTPEVKNGCASYIVFNSLSHLSV